MATSTSVRSSAFRNQSAWIPAMFGVAVICGESTNTMGANHTAIWLSQFAAWVGHPNGPLALINHLLRKSGHFTGYGLLGVFFARGWFSLLRRHVSAGWSGLRMRAALLGILCAALVASADEIHQSFLSTRGASPWDVLLDTSGAVTLNLLFFGFLAVRRNRMLNPQAPFTTLGLSIAALPERLSGSREMRGLVVHSTRRISSLRTTVRRNRQSRLPVEGASAGS